MAWRLKWLPLAVREFSSLAEFVSFFLPVLNSCHMLQRNFFFSQSVSPLFCLPFEERPMAASACRLGGHPFLI